MNHESNPGDCKVPSVERPKQPLYTEKDLERAIAFTRQGEARPNPYMSAFRNDVRRVIHAPCFRRLQGKIQLFPGSESEFFRTRLTHTIEVAQIAKTLAYRLNALYLRENDLEIDPDLVEFAALCHDLGHPPFGHTGEEALNDAMRDYGGFEGNAQTFRIIARLEKREFRQPDEAIFDEHGRDLRVGLNITYRGLASVLKYDRLIPKGRTASDGVPKGYYASEAELVGEIKRRILGVEELPAEYKKDWSFKTLECQIMDIADDIAYSTFDLEDGFESGLITLGDLYYPNHRTLEQCLHSFRRLKKDHSFEKIIRVLRDFVKRAEGFLPPSGSEAADESLGRNYLSFREISTNGYARTQFIGKWIESLVENVSIKIDKTVPALSTVFVSEAARDSIDILKQFTFNFLTLSPRLQHADYRGRGIVRTIFDAVAENWESLLPLEYQELISRYPVSSDDIRQFQDHKMRTVCDYVASLSDRDAAKLYARLKSVNSVSIFSL